MAEMSDAWRHRFATITANRSIRLDDMGMALSKLPVEYASSLPLLQIRSAPVNWLPLCLLLYLCSGRLG